MKAANGSWEAFAAAPAARGAASAWKALLRPGVLRRAYLVLGGPGCGKSTLLGRVAAHARQQGERVELLRCAQAPDSFDGVRLIDRGVLLVDATEPHPAPLLLPGAFSRVVDLTAGLSAGRLAEDCQRLARLSAEETAARARAGSLLAAAGLVQGAGAAVAVEQAKLARAADRLAGMIPPGDGAGEGRRCLEGLGGTGLISLAARLPAAFGRIVLLEDEAGVAHLLLEKLRQAALAQRQQVLCCGDPLRPARLRHLLLPAADLAVLTSDRLLPVTIPGVRKLHTRRFVDAGGLQAGREWRKFSEKLTASLLAQAAEQRRAAAGLHAELEQAYKAAMDYTVARESGDRLLREIFADAA